jgi:hypothetical protein
MKRALALVGLVLGVAACGSGDLPLAEPETSSTLAGSAPTSTGDLTLQTTPPSETDLLALASEARADLAGRLDVAEEEIAVTSAAVVTWNDGSIGCPQPGMAYTQALVEGSRITLEHDGTTYAYHQGAGRLFWCEEPTEDSYLLSEDDSGRLQMTPPPGFND